MRERVTLPSLFPGKYLDGNSPVWSSRTLQNNGGIFLPVRRPVKEKINKYIKVIGFCALSSKFKLSVKNLTLFEERNSLLCWSNI